MKKLIILSLLITLSFSLNIQANNDVTIRKKTLISLKELMEWSKYGFRLSGIVKTTTRYEHHFEKVSDMYEIYYKKVLKVRQMDKVDLAKLEDDGWTFIAVEKYPGYYHHFFYKLDLK